MHQILALCDSVGWLMYGQEDVPKDVLEYTEFESFVGMTYGMTSWNDI